VAALISYPAGFLSDRFGRKAVLLISFLVFLIAYLGFALTRNLPLIALLFVFYGLYQGIFRSAGKAFASDFVPQHLRASAIGWYSTTIGLLELVASIIAGLLWDHVSHEAVFIYGAVFAVIGGAALLALVPGESASAS
jgi:MFS family permease